jgi:hypothetical protein
LWLFVNLTLSPLLIVTDVGLMAPFAPMVIVAVTGPGLPPPPPGLGDGALLEPPHAIANATAGTMPASVHFCVFVTMVPLIDRLIQALAHASKEFSRDVES